MEKKKCNEFNLKMDNCRFSVKYVYIEDEILEKFVNKIIID